MARRVSITQNWQGRPGFLRVKARDIGADHIDELSGACAGRRGAGVWSGLSRFLKWSRGLTCGIPSRTKSSTVAPANNVDQTMRILLVIHGYPMRFNAGSEVYTQALAQGLATQHTVQVFTGAKIHSRRSSTYDAIG